MSSISHQSTILFAAASLAFTFSAIAEEGGHAVEASVSEVAAERVRQEAPRHIVHAGAGAGATVDFKNFINNTKGLVLVKIGAPWCGPCKKLEKAMEILIEKEEYNRNGEKDRVGFVSINIDTDKPLYGELTPGSKTIPKLVAFYNGKRIHVELDGLDKKSLLKVIEKARSSGQAK